jgi:hypothetical protein
MVTDEFLATGWVSTWSHSARLDRKFDFFGRTHFRVNVKVPTS